MLKSIPGLNDRTFFWPGTVNLKAMAVNLRMSVEDMRNELNQIDAFVSASRPVAQFLGYDGGR